MAPICNGGARDIISCNKKKHDYGSQLISEIHQMENDYSDSLTAQHKYILQSNV
jgi:hypothetical protein